MNKEPTFEKLVKYLKEEEIKKKADWWAPNKLDIETRLLMTLEYI